MRLVTPLIAATATAKEHETTLEPFQPVHTVTGICPYMRATPSAMPYCERGGILPGLMRALGVDESGFGAGAIRSDLEYLYKDGYQEKYLAKSPTEEKIRSIVMGLLNTMISKFLPDSIPTSLGTMISDALGNSLGLRESPMQDDEGTKDPSLVPIAPSLRNLGELPAEQFRPLQEGLMYMMPLFVTGSILEELKDTLPETKAGLADMLPIDVNPVSILPKPSQMFLSSRLMAAVLNNVMDMTMQYGGASAAILGKPLLENLKVTSTQHMSDFICKGMKRGLSDPNPRLTQCTTVDLLSTAFGCFSHKKYVRPDVCKEWKDKLSTKNAPEVMTYHSPDVKYSQNQVSWEYVDDRYGACTSDLAEETYKKFNENYGYGEAPFDSRTFVPLDVVDLLAEYGHISIGNLADQIGAEKVKDITRREGLTTKFLFDAAQLVHRVTKNYYACDADANLSIIPGWETGLVLALKQEGDTFSESNDRQSTGLIFFLKHAYKTMPHGKEYNCKVPIITRGTGTEFEWKMDLMTQFAPVPSFTSRHVNWVHGGYWAMLSTILPGMDEYIQEEIMSETTGLGCSCDQIQFILSGHSLGGGISEVLGLYLAEKYGSPACNAKVAVYNFAGPRVFDAATASRNGNLVNTRTYATELDPIPASPCAAVDPAGNIGDIPTGAYKNGWVRCGRGHQVQTAAEDMPPRQEKYTAFVNQNGRIILEQSWFVERYVVKNPATDKIYGESWDNDVMVSLDSLMFNMQKKSLTIKDFSMGLTSNLQIGTWHGISYGCWADQWCFKDEEMLSLHQFVDGPVKTMTPMQSYLWSECVANPMSIGSIKIKDMAMNMG